MFFSSQSMSLAALLVYSTQAAVIQNSPRAAKLNNVTYKGCYQEAAAGKRGLAQFATLNNAAMTPSMCRDYCATFPSTYFGLENGRECHCGNDLSTLTLATDAKCTTKCAGSAQDICGQGTTFVNVYASDTQYHIGGSWGSLIKFPNIPVAVALLPDSGNLLTWSSGFPATWTSTGNGKTYTSVYDVKTKNVSQSLIQYTQHDMFCPGIAMQEDGRINVNGGSTAGKTSIFDYKNSLWTASGGLKIPRGYQSSTLTSDGLIFTLGGSFSGVGGAKDGEIFDPATGNWTKLANSPARPAAINQGVGMGVDSHAWLFAWKNGYVFQAGPSKQMNWYGTRGVGGQKTIGNRGTDNDAMCGLNVMYDAVNGKIFTLGGSPTYGGSASTTNAHIITIGNPNEAVNVEKINGARYARTFGNSVVMPDGKIFLVGGQTYSTLFSDNNPVLWPEIFDPETRSFKTMGAHYTARNYHSVSLLMPDATIFVGGGGLCGAGCAANHFDGEFFTPPYLYQADGKTLASRPSFASVSADSVNGNAAVVKAGSQIKVRMAAAGDYTFSLIRMGSATHAVNTDQRRIPLTGGSGSDFTLNMPSDSGIALPGFWMLFANDKNGVPSVAKHVQVLRA